MRKTGGKQKIFLNMSRAAKWGQNSSFLCLYIIVLSKITHIEVRQLHVRKRLIRDFTQLQNTNNVCVFVIFQLFSQSNIEQMGQRTNNYKVVQRVR